MTMSDQLYGARQGVMAMSEQVTAMSDQLYGAWQDGPRVFCKGWSWIVKIWCVI